MPTGWADYVSHHKSITRRGCCFELKMDIPSRVETLPCTHSERRDYRHHGDVDYLEFKEQTIFTYLFLTKLTKTVVNQVRQF